MNGEQNLEEEGAVEVNYEYKTSKDHREFYANRVAGGWAHGETLTMNFLAESTALPESEVRRHASDGSTQVVDREGGEHELVRKCMATVHMPLEEVEKFQGWLEQRVQDMKRAKRESDASKEGIEQED